MCIYIMCNYTLMWFRTIDNIVISILICQFNHAWFDWFKNIMLMENVN